MTKLQLAISHLPEGLQVFFKRDQIAKCFHITVKNFKNPETIVLDCSLEETASLYRSISISMSL